MVYWNKLDQVGCFVHGVSLKYLFGGTTSLISREMGGGKKGR